MVAAKREIIIPLVYALAATGLLMWASIDLYHHAKKGINKATKIDPQGRDTPKRVHVPLIKPLGKSENSNLYSGAEQEAITLPKKTVDPVKKVVVKEITPPAKIIKKEPAILEKPLHIPEDVPKKRPFIRGSAHPKHKSTPEADAEWNKAAENFLKTLDPPKKTSVPVPAHPKHKPTPEADEEWDKAVEELLKVIEGHLTTDKKPLEIPPKDPLERAADLRHKKEPLIKKGQKNEFDRKFDEPIVPVETEIKKIVKPLGERAKPAAAPVVKAEKPQAQHVSVFERPHAGPEPAKTLPKRVEEPDTHQKKKLVQGKDHYTGEDGYDGTRETSDEFFGTDTDE